MIWIYLPTQDAGLATSKIRALTSYTWSYDPILITGRGPLCRTTIREFRPTPELNLHWVRGIDARDQKGYDVACGCGEDTLLSRCNMFCVLWPALWMQVFFPKGVVHRSAFELNRSCRYTSVTGESDWTTKLVLLQFYSWYLIAQYWAILFTVSWAGIYKNTNNKQTIYTLAQVYKYIYIYT